MELIDIKKISKKNLFLIFGWIIIWLSIGITPEYLINFKFSLSINLFNYFRGIFPIIYFILIIFYFSNQIKGKIFYRKNYITFLVGFYLALQLIPLITKKSSNVVDIYYLILSFCALLIISLKMFQKNEDNKFFFISVFFIFILFINFFFYQVKNFLFTPLTFYEQWGVAAEQENFLKNLNFDFIYPNILGFSRYTLILFFFTFFFIKKYNFLRCLILVFLSSLIFLLQARSTILIYLTFIFFYLFITKNLKFIDYAKKIFLLLLIPIVIFFLVNYSKTNFFLKHKVELRNQAEIELYKEKTARLFRKLPLTNEPTPKLNFSSDRFSDWVTIIDGSKNEFWGLGPQADRVHYKKTASNAFVYSFVSAGYLGLFIFSILFIYSVYLILKNILLYRKLSFNFNKLIYPTICFTFLIRSIFETSIAVFGIDFLLFFYCLFTIQKLNEKLV